MVYTVGETARLLNVAPSTLRFYDKEGLLPFIERSGGGIRLFKEEDLEFIRIINCLKKTGMSLKDIREFIKMTMDGDRTIDDRLHLFFKQRETVQKQLEELKNTLDTIEYKCWYYETAKKAGTTRAVEEMPENDIPERFKRVRENLSGKNIK